MEQKKMMWDEREIEVSEILLNLGALIHQSEACVKQPKLPFTWGCKKSRRSNCNRDAIAAASAPPPSSQHHHHHDAIHTAETTTFGSENNDDGDDDKSKVGKKDKAEASSPATPLSFTSAESHDKSKHSSLRKSFKKRTREEWLEIIEGLTQSREVLRGEVENVRSYYNKLKAFNMELKAMKHERLTAYASQQFPHVEINKALNLGISITPHHQNNYAVHPELQHPYCHVAPLFSSSNGGNGLGTVRCIPDLNVCPEEAFGVDYLQSLNYGHNRDHKKAMAAEKRMIRRMINVKKRNEQRSR